MLDRPRSPVIIDDWGLNSISRLPKTNDYKAIILSDLHLPRRDGHPKYLYEFLQHNTCDTLILLGDTHEGYDASLGDLNEMNLRFWDLVSARKAQGMKVIDVPGNHDSYKRRDEILGHKVFGTEYWNDLVVDTHEGPTLFMHGDVVDGNAVKRYDKVAYKIAKKIAIGNRSLLDIHSSLESLSDSLFGGKKKKTNCLDVEFAAAKIAQEKGCAAVVTGHTHKPADIAPVLKKPDILYGNTGAWVGGLATAMVMKHDGQLELVRWTEDRREYYAKKPQGSEMPNMHKSFRDASLAEFNWQKAQHALFGQEALVLQTLEALKNVEKIRNRVERFLHRAEEQLEKTHLEVKKINSFAKIERLENPVIAAPVASVA